MFDSDEFSIHLFKWQESLTIYYSKIVYWLFVYSIYRKLINFSGDLEQFRKKCAPVFIFNKTIESYKLRSLKSNKRKSTTTIKKTNRKKTSDFSSAWMSYRLWLDQLLVLSMWKISQSVGSVFFSDFWTYYDEVADAIGITNLWTKLERNFYLFVFCGRLPKSNYVYLLFWYILYVLICIYIIYFYIEGIARKQLCFVSITTSWPKCNRS